MIKRLVQLLRALHRDDRGNVGMLLLLIVMLLVGLIGFEMVQSTVAHRPPGMMTRAIGDVLSGVGVPAKFAK